MIFLGLALPDSTWQSVLCKEVIGDFKETKGPRIGNGFNGLCIRQQETIWTLEPRIIGFRVILCNHLDKRGTAHDETHGIVFLFTWETCNLRVPAEYVVNGILVEGSTCMDKDGTPVSISKVTAPIFNAFRLDLDCNELLWVGNPCCPRLVKANTLHDLFTSFTFYLLRHDNSDLWHCTSQKVND